MELLFLWIEDFRVFRKQYFNFSSDLHFSVEQIPDENGVTYHLKIQHNREYVDLFTKNLLNVTAIIGKNGAGKSTLFHCIKLMMGQLPRLTSPLIFCIRNEDGKIQTYYYHGGGREMQSLNVKVSSDEKEKKLNILRPKPYSIQRFAGEHGKIKEEGLDFPDIKCVYLANVFDSHNEEIYDGINNKSTNARVEDFLKEYLKTLLEKQKEKEKSKKKDPPELVIYPSHIQDYHNKERRKLMQFIAYAKSRQTENIVSLPQSMRIAFTFDDYEYLMTGYKGSPLYSREDIARIHKLAADHLKDIKNQKEIFEKLILLSVFYYALRWDTYDRNRVSTENVYNSIKKIASDKQRLFENIREMIYSLKLFNQPGSKSKKVRDYIDENLKRALRYVELTTLPAGGIRIFEAKITSSLWSLLNLINELRDIIDITFLEYHWVGGLSTGQESFLGQFARLYEVRNDIEQGDTLWLMIDEGDLHAHAEWQRLYLDELIKYINLFFPMNKVQLFITTHSPFIISDLPKQHLIFLKGENEDGYCKVVDPMLRKETFGANINVLYSDTFFLKKLIGSFAEQKINEIFDWADNKIEAKHPPVYYLNLIKQVGEPILAAKLFQAYVKKMKLPVEEAELEMWKSKIDDRLKEIREKKK